MAGISSEYYKLVWDAVRQGPASALEQFESRERLKEIESACAEAEGKKEFRQLDLPLRLACVVYVLSEALAKQSLDIAVDAAVDASGKEQACALISEVRRFYDVMSATLAEERAEYRVSSGLYNSAEQFVSLIKRCCDSLTKALCQASNA